MTNESHERIIDVEGNALKISVEGPGGTLKEIEIEVQRMSGAISENLIGVTNNLTLEGGDVDRLARHAMELIEKGKCLVWVGKFEDIPRMVTAAYIYPDADSVIPAIIAKVNSKELLRNWKTWDQETFMSVAIAILGSAQAFDDLSYESPRRALNVEEFNTIFQQDSTKVQIKPLDTKVKSK